MKHMVVYFMFDRLYAKQRLNARNKTCVSKFLVPIYYYPVNVCRNLVLSWWNYKEMIKKYIIVLIRLNVKWVVVFFAVFYVSSFLL